MKYDCIVVGAGSAGIFACYELITKNKDLKVLLIDKGNDIYKRHCPILEGKINKCPIQKNGLKSCYPACSITNGFGGAGAYSDGKFNITNEFGGWLNEYISDEELIDLIKYVDDIYLAHGATEIITNPETNEVHEIERKALAHGLKLLKAQVRHLGTENNLSILKNIFEELKNRVEMHYAEEVTDVLLENGNICGVKTDKSEYYSKYVVIAPGRDGSTWVEELCDKLNIPMKNNHVDIGVRVETNNEIMEEINKNLYEGKFIYHASCGTTVRTFCSNPYGHVVVENHSGTILANGHAYSDINLGSQNTNFAILVSHEFSDPFNEPNEFAHYVSRLANMISNGGVLVQRYGDLIKGRRTTESRLKNNFVRPTLKEAVPGDLGLVLPYNTMKSIVEMIEVLNYITPGIASEHTLMYGVEAKFYSARPEVNENFESPVKNLYFGGDGAGLTRGLAQAGANGIKIARSIIENMGKDC